MATTTSYLLITRTEDPDAVQEHSVFNQHDFEPIESAEEDADGGPALKFVHEAPLEDNVDLHEPARQLSTDVSEGTVVLCEVEERFDQIEHVEVLVFRNGKTEGEVEHGYIFNVGSG